MAGYDMVVTQSNGTGIAEAAKLLNMTPGALRKRVQRGSLPSYKGEDGNWYVRIEEAREKLAQERGEPEAPPEPEPEPQPTVTEEPKANGLVPQLESEIAFLREELARRDEELRRRDVIILEMTRRFPEQPLALENGEVEPAPNEKPSLWRRLWYWPREA
jgi:hypothetical protein